MTVARAMKRVLIWMTVLVLLSATVIAVIGYAQEGTPGLISGLIGGVMTLVFSGLTAVSLLVAIRGKAENFLAVILGFWAGKIVLFLVIVILLRGRDFIVPWVLISSMLVAAVITLAVDAIIVLRARVPYVSPAVLTGEQAPDAPSDATSEEPPRS